MNILRSIWICIIAGLLVACESPTQVSSELPGPVNRMNAQNSKVVVQDGRNALQSNGTSEMHKGFAKLRRATAEYHRLQAALDAGFVPVGPCQENPDGTGALGIPYLNPDRLDATIDLENPEVLFYEPLKNGKLRLVGVETVVPIDLWNEDEPPSLFGAEFHRNDDAGLFGRHMWIWRHNSDGILAFWHPEVSCDYAG